MFERYTEKARRVVFFARYEASTLGSRSIGTEHLLLGFLREDEALASRIFSRPVQEIKDVRQEIQESLTAAEWIPVSVELPLRPDGKRALGYAFEEADRMDSKRIDAGHLLLGLLREEETKAAEILHDRGVTLSQVRKELEEE